jgi:tripartite-type tricarboxylate transporter receptor subunit TctC
MRSMAFGTAARSAILAGALISSALPAFAQDNWPTKTIRIVLSFGAPGGAPDVAARLLAPELTKAWGQSVIVDPKTGAGGIIGAETVAKSAPDGYTWLINSPAHVINVALYAGKLPYDPITDFTPVTLLGEVPNLLIIVPSVPARTVKEFIAHAKANPGKLNYGSAGTGSSQHLAGELFAKMAGVKMTHVPYKGGGAVVTDLLAGQLQLTFGSATSLPSIRAGKLVALGVSGLKRDPNVPDLPTISEAALPGYEASAWYALYGPARTPKPIVDKMYYEVARIFKIPDVREKLNFVTMQPIASTPDELAVYVKKELAKWSVIVKESGAKPE